MRTLKLTIAYDGTRFVGWQRQAEGESIQGLLEDALARFEGAPVTVHGAGRTDAGVHALGQVASVRVTCSHDASTLTRALNAQLPEDVRVLVVEEAAADFHARFSARSKTYRYVIRNAPIATPFERAYVWHLPEPLNVKAMQQAAALMSGTHDFAAFQSVGTSTPDSVRTILRSEIVRLPFDAAPGVPSNGREMRAGTTQMDSEPTLLAYEVTGEGFLRHMVRALTGTLVEIGRGWRNPDSIGVLLANRRRAEAGATAPPHGLFLVSVDYH
jgi:tRNA pseudouridine38-40 synthase